MVFRGWECSHSIRSEILLRYWCPDFFQLRQKYFFDRSKIFFEHFRKSENFRDFFEIFSRFSKKSKFSKKISTFCLWKFSIFENFENFQILKINFLQDEKLYFVRIFLNCLGMFFHHPKHVFRALMIPSERCYSA